MKKKSRTIVEKPWEIQDMRKQAEINSEGLIKTDCSGTRIYYVKEFLKKLERRNILHINLNFSRKFENKSKFSKEYLIYTQGFLRFPGQKAEA